MSPRKYLLYFLFFLFGAAASYFIPSFFYKNPANIMAIREHGNYTFINPLLECESSDVRFNNAVSSLEKSLLNYIEEQKRDGKASHISVYFRDLNNGPWIGIDEKEQFSPASLLKLPLFMTYLKYAESDPSIFKKQIMVTEEATKKSSNIVQFSPEPTVLQKNTEYTVEDLLEFLVLNSDNTALTLLTDHIKEEAYSRIYKDLDLPIPLIHTNSDFLSVREYSTFYRVLYNASYLSQDYSEKALELLSQTKFNNGLVKGVGDDSIKIAHKFGERGLADGQKQLHDCGIVYAPHHPYLLCIMTRGTSFEELSATIQEISHTVYTYVKQT